MRDGCIEVTSLLTQVRNPWGSHEWTGDYCDASPLWTPELRAAVHALVQEVCESVIHLEAANPVVLT